jgi:hypothetical protein
MMIRISLRGDWRNQLRCMYPRITADMVDRFAIMAEADNIITDEGLPTPALVGWCKGAAQ